MCKIAAKYIHRKCQKKNVNYDGKRGIKAVIFFSDTGGARKSEVNLLDQLPAFQGRNVLSGHRMCGLGEGREGGLLSSCLFVC